MVLSVEELRSSGAQRLLDHPVKLNNLAQKKPSLSADNFCDKEAIFPPF
jgi:hypothetical protein